MRLDRATNERKLYFCRWYFYGGFFFLPFLWAINAIWFYQEAFRKPAYEEQKIIKTYVLRSGVGAVLWIVGLVAWTVAFQTNRAYWGEIGDNLSFVIPTGRA